MASRRSRVAAQLVRALALRLKQAGACPLTPLHIAGEKNAMTDIPSRSFGSNPSWHCRTNHELRLLYIKKFPLPNQQSWTVYQPPNAISMRVISVLRTRAMTMAEWRRLPSVGRHIGDIGKPTAGLWEWTLNYRTSSTDKKSGSCRGMPPGVELGTMAKDEGSRLRQYQALSRPLARLLPWCTARTQRNSASPTTSHQD